MTNLAVDPLALKPIGATSSGASRSGGLAAEVREARAKLAASLLPRYGFEFELLRLFAKGRRSSTPAMAGLGVVVAGCSTFWVPADRVILWFLFYCLTLYLAFRFAGRLLAAEDGVLDIHRWRRKFIFIETFQGVAWGMILWLIGEAGNPEARGFALVLLLLIAAMNATTSASIPAAVASALTPMTLAILSFLYAANCSPTTLGLIALAFGTQFYFMFLARRLHETALATLSFQAEKDELIAELEQAKINSDHARRRAEAANLAKSRFLATMSHELRTPLNAILGFSEVMKSELFGSHVVASYKDYSNDIHSSGQHLLMLINEILDLSRIEAGRFELKEEAVSLEEIVSECRRLLGLRAKKRHITIVRAVEKDLPSILADARAVRQIVLNLLSNAIKFTPKGGLIKIRIGWTSKGGQYVAVRDSGPGIPEEEIPIIMSSFGRGSLAQKNAEEGSGLGLPIVKGLVELHGGTFLLKSKLREGTEVIVIFPPERVVDSPPVAEEEKTGRAELRLRDAVLPRQQEMTIETAR